MNFDKAELLASESLMKKKNTRTLFLSPTLSMVAGEEGQVGSWEQAQNTFMASVKMACQIHTAV